MMFLKFASVYFPTTILLPIIAFLIFEGSLHAQSTWTGDGDGVNWDDPDNWSPSGVPTAASDAIFDGGPYTINVSSAAVADELQTMEGTNVTLTGGNTLTLSGNTTLRGGELTIDGSTITGGVGLVAFGAGTTSVVNVQGTGSQWNSSALVAGHTGNGTINVTDGGVVSNGNGFISLQSGSTGAVNIDGAGSQWINSGNLEMAVRGDATLNISNGGFVSSNDLIVSEQPQTNGVLRITSGGSLSTVTSTIARFTSSTGSVLVDGVGSRWDNSSSILVGGGGTGSLNIANGGVVSSSSLRISERDETGIVEVRGSGSRLDLTSLISIGSNSGHAELNVLDGGVVTNGDEEVGIDVRIGSSGTGVVNVSGQGSRWENSTNAEIGALDGIGTFNISNGGVISNASGELGVWEDSVGTVNVDGVGSRWENSFSIEVGSRGQGTMNITNGGVVSSSNGSIGALTGSTGIVTVDGADSAWTGSSNLFVGSLGDGTLNVTNGGFVSNVHGIVGRQSFDDLGTGVATISGVGSHWSNSGDLTVGENGASGTLNITTGGLVTVDGATFLTSTGSTLIDDGQLNSIGGLTNAGELSLSDGEVRGQVTNLADGIISVVGGNESSFFDDVVMSADNLYIDVADGSTAVFHGSFNGGSTGLGDVEVKGELRPGSSPASVSFGGDLLLDLDSELHIELAGTALGEFDQLVVSGDLSLNGELIVSQINGFSISDGDQFLIADVASTLVGQFSSLAEGDLVSSFGSHDLFVTYAAGDGNDVALIALSAVPEPSAAIAIAFAALLMTRRRKRGAFV
jgi:T5SS/PEP-CTERM-associated repeat protein